MGAIVGLSLSASSFAQCDYQITAISRPGCSSFGQPAPRALNDNGIVVGYAVPCQSITEKACRWSERDGFSFLNLGPGIAASRSTAVSPGGAIGGIYQTGGLASPWRGFLWKDGVVQLIPPPPGEPGTSVWVEGFFDEETVAGYLADSINPRRAFLWRNGAYLGIGQGFDPTYRSFLGAGVAGWVVGKREMEGTQDWVARVCSVSPDASEFAEIEIPLPWPLVRGEGWEVSSRGHVVGRAEKPDPRTGLADSRYRAFYWDGSTTTIVEPQPGHSGSMFFDINDLGQAVGMSECQGSLVGCSPWFQAQAILYQNGTVTVLDPLIEGPRGRSGFCTYAIGVNNNGQILIEGQSAAGGAFLLTPPWMAGDVNADCRVNAHDITLLLENWGPVGQGTVRRADVDEDGEVGGMDLGLLLGGWTGE